jgi:hypothetical protein
LLFADVGKRPILFEREIAMKQTPSHIIVTIYFAMLLLARPASAVMDSVTPFTLDITKPGELAKKAEWWSASKNVESTEEGLTLNAPANHSADVWLQITEPIAVGWSWRPVQSVYIEGQVDPPGEFTFQKNQMTFPSGSLYARYSADALHWSDWQYLGFERPKDQNNPKQRYAGTLRVPQRQRQHYQDLLGQYQKLDVPWKSDEEAAVKWILQNDPKFFEKPAPFIGYIQFLYETSLKGGHYIKTLSFDIYYSTGGRHTAPKNEDVYKGRSETRWRFKAPPLRKKNGPDP